MRIFNDQLCAESLSNEYLLWLKNYDHNGRDADGLRFGQYICNKYLCLRQTAPEIFYMEDSGKAFWLIFDVLVNQES